MKDVEEEEELGKEKEDEAKRMCVCVFKASVSSTD